MQHTLPAALPLSTHGDAAPHHGHHAAAVEHAHAPARAGEHAHHHGTPALDRLGAVLGFACAVHCIAVPFLIGVLPALGLGFVADHAFDLTIVITASMFAALAARSGWRAHRDGRVLAGFALAIVLLILGDLIGEEGLAGRMPSVLGGFTLAATHLANLRLSKRSCARAHAS